MPEYLTPNEAASAAYYALSTLAHTVRQTPPPELYGLTGELLGIARLLPDVLRKTSSLTLAQNDEATVPGDPSPRAGVHATEDAARAFIRAADHLDRAETDLDHASQHLSTIAWRPTPGRAPEPVAQHLGRLPDAVIPVQQVERGTLPPPQTPSAQAGPGLGVVR